MYAGKSFTTAMDQARASAAWSNADRYVHQYNGDFWISAKPPSTVDGGYWTIHPDGTLEKTVEP